MDSERTLTFTGFAFSADCANAGHFWSRIMSLETSFNASVRSLKKLLQKARETYPSAELVVLDGSLCLYASDSEKTKEPLFSSSGLHIDGGGR